MLGFDPVTLTLSLALLALVPIAIMTTTSFLKISIVLSLVRTALGVQQTPPNIILYALSLMLTVFIMAPVGSAIVAAADIEAHPAHDAAGFISAAKRGAEPMRKFLLANSKVEQRDFFVAQAKRIWPPKMAEEARQDDLLILVPAFLVTEMTAAFEIGFLLFLPFIVIDLVVSNILMAMGMMMVSPATITLPLKLFLFVMVDGWSRLLHGMILTYRL
ncbi:MAG TPA: type III secretion system export apparatus subunit SctR [Ramlibacter sp.]|uniref:type III secretion system export apparatus subunit SctR n=1 Tax=Ramlibacter sp. TaxID=1917967 RepID=UPI002CA7CA34|nr:type III secretion system export apparatus subunit SctR [Ramlibacter sp.]HVZ45037.1 type III secretion system export apparatus subunit SctR [Ramlibacter sp.]